MHEMSIISHALNSVEMAAGEHQLGRITQIVLEIGKIRAAVPALLKSAFEELSPGTIYEGAELIVEEIDVDLECRVCGRHIESEDSLLGGCPSCGSHRIKLLKGNECRIKSISGE